MPQWLSSLKMRFFSRTPSTGNSRIALGYVCAPLIDMGKRSAGLLMFRRRKDQLQVFLVHPGGPFWKNKDAGAWSIPKGEYGKREIQSMRRSESSKRKQGSNPRENSFPLIR